MVLSSPDGKSGLPYLVWSAGQREFVPLLLGLYLRQPVRWKRFLEKHAWLLNWLRTEARDLAALTTRRTNGKAFFWLATEAGVPIRQGSQQAIRLQAAGFDLPRQKIILS